MLTLSEGGSPSHPRHPNTEAHHQTMQTGSRGNLQKWFPWSHNIVSCSKYCKQPYKMLHFSWRPYIMTHLFAWSKSRDIKRPVWSIVAFKRPFSIIIVPSTCITQRTHRMTNVCGLKKNMKWWNIWWKRIKYHHCDRNRVLRLRHLCDLSYAHARYFHQGCRKQAGTIIVDVNQRAFLYFNEILPYYYISRKCLWGWPKIRSFEQCYVLSVGST